MSDINISAKNIGIRLPNGKVKMMKADNPSDKDKEFNSDEEFYKAYPNVNESTGVTSLILDMINE